MILNQSAISTVKDMLSAFMVAKNANLSTEQVAEKHINGAFKEEHDQLDQKTKKIFDKLFLLTNGYVKQFSLIQQELVKMNMATKKEDTSGRFVCSFVLASAKHIVEKLKNEHPGVLEQL